MLTKINAHDIFYVEQLELNYIYRPCLDHQERVLKPVNTFSVPGGSLIIVHIFAAEEAARKTNRNHYQKGIRMGSSPTFTVATENRWPSRSI